MGIPDFPHFFFKLPNNYKSRKAVKKILCLLFCFVLFNNPVKSQELNNRLLINDEEILFGYCNRDGLYDEPFDQWFLSEYEEYVIDYSTLGKIDTSFFNNVKITLVMGTWCGDSKREVPRFYKIIDELNYDESNLTMISVDRDKLAPVIEFEEMNIKRVPTFIFYSDGVEIGRIIEYPEDSLEKDLYKILSEK